MVVILSSVLLGAAGAVVITNFSNLPQRWFPANEQTLATSVAVYTNYAVWALSALLVPMFVKTRDDMDHFLLVQAIIASVGIVLFLLVYRARPERTPSGADTGTSTAVMTTVTLATPHLAHTSMVKPSALATTDIASAHARPSS